MKRWFIRLPLILAGLTAALIITAAAALRIANQTNGSLVSSGVERRYLLYVPESYDPTVPTPLVITLHGLVQWPANQMQVSHWNELADRHGFLVVSPSGTQFPLRWRTSGDSAEGTEEDVQFISDLIDHLAAEYNIDTRRVYANGLSNGAGMSFVLACELSERIAAVGLVNGAYFYAWDSCDSHARPVPAVVFHGTEDRIVPMQGGPVRGIGLTLPDINQWVETLARHNGCEGSSLELPPSGEVRGKQFEGCQADLVFYTVTGGGHSWPGGEGLPRLIVGHTTQDMDATEVMWSFFLDHPLPKK